MMPCRSSIHICQQRTVWKQPVTITEDKIEESSRKFKINYELDNGLSNARFTMRTFASAGTVKKSYLLQLPLKDSCLVHVRLPISRRPPDEAPTADAGSGTHSYWPSRQDRGTIGASDRLM